MIQNERWNAVWHLRLTILLRDCHNVTYSNLWKKGSVFVHLIWMICWVRVTSLFQHPCFSIRKRYSSVCTLGMDCHICTSKCHKSLFPILPDLSERDVIWKESTEMSRAAFLEEDFGKRNQLNVRSMSLQVTSRENVKEKECHFPSRRWIGMSDAVSVRQREKYLWDWNISCFVSNTLLCSISLESQEKLGNKGKYRHPTHKISRNMGMWTVRVERNRSVASAMWIEY